ncbi:hypothetical protein DFH08DRAFT_819666 [Mycena albidolilacea]|uniref:Uncharacterized protein n=1 Tax=Mycena albidolilacea TaxID=1033008 RepID=A0AAD6ZED2_9AGAR|nr:hypothetical protein DFH08DRAFT_819666 [Mycena albidolilacea]
MSVAVLLFLLRLIGLWLIQLDWVGIGLGFWFWFSDAMVERMMRWIRWREWKETGGKLFWFSHTTLSSMLVVPPHLLLSRQHSTLIDWIAAHIYFVWSPNLTTHIGLVVDTIIELGNVGNEQERKVLLTKILQLYPEIAAHESGTLENLERLCAEFHGIRQNEEGRLRWFGIRFCSLAKQLQRPPALVTNRDACARYLRTMDSGFAHCVCRAVEEREIARVLLQQLGIDSQTGDRSTWRREDTIALQDLVQITEAIARTNVSYLQSDATNRAQGKIPARDQLSMNGIQIEERPKDLAGLCRAVQNDTVAAFTQILNEGAAALTKDRACVTETALEKSSRTPGKEFNGKEKTKAAFADISAPTACRVDDVDILRKGIFHELGMVQDELRSIQRQLKETRESTPRTQEIHLRMDMLRRQMQENRDLRLEDLRDGQQNVGALLKEMRSKIELVQGELCTIQTRLRVCETAPNQQLWDLEPAASFLQNWLRQETQVVKKNSDGDGSTRKKRPFMPLLTKNQRKVLEWAKMALQQPHRFPNRKDKRISPEAEECKEKHSPGPSDGCWKLHGVSDALCRRKDGKMGMVMPDDRNLLFMLLDLEAQGSPEVHG